jgi:hypothetical protein
MPRTFDCSPCKATGTKDRTGRIWDGNTCPKCDGYGYVHPPKGWFFRRHLKSGEYFFFFSAWDDDPKENWDPRDYVELNGGGCLMIGTAEAYDVEHDRKKNFFFTIGEARQALSKIRTIINQAK